MWRPHGVRGAGNTTPIWGNAKSRGRPTAKPRRRVCTIHPIQRAPFWAKFLSNAGTWLGKAPPPALALAGVCFQLSFPLSSSNLCNHEGIWGTEQQPRREILACDPEHRGYPHDQETSSGLSEALPRPSGAHVTSGGPGTAPQVMHCTTPKGTTLKDDSMNGGSQELCDVEVLGPPLLDQLLTIHTRARGLTKEVKKKAQTYFVPFSRTD